jgi:hypothetical protein
MTALPAELALPEAPFVLFVLTNQARVDKGLPPLTWDDKVAKAAATHAQVMAGRGAVSHQFDGEPELGARLVAQDVRLARVSENVDYDQSIQSAFASFMNSASHRTNILDPEIDTVGIGVAEAGGQFYIAQDFIRQVSTVSDAQAEKTIADAFRSLRLNSNSGPLEFVPDPRLHQAAQAMAEQEAPNAAAAMALVKGHAVAAFATSTPEVLPPSVAHLGTTEGATRFSVGVCFARTSKYPSGFYWVTIVLF